MNNFVWNLHDVCAFLYLLEAPNWHENGVKSDKLYSN